MAILPIFEKRDTRAIMKLLSSQNLSAAEVNQELVINQNICSTASLYRRLRDLKLANITEKIDGKYKLTKYGKNIYDQFNEIKVVSSSSYNEQLLLKYFRKPVSFKGLLGKLSISPNDLKKSIQRLLADDLITVIDGKYSGKGRPAIYYQLTNNGEVVFNSSDKLRRKASRRR